MAEKIISPGVFTNEIDQSFLPSAVADIGAALVGPTLKGPAGIPTVVTSFSEFQAKFGDVFRSGSNSFQFLTSHTAEQYLKNSDTLTVVRVMDGTFSPATASVQSSNTVGATFASQSFRFIANPSGSVGLGTAATKTGGPDEFRIGNVSFVFVSSSAGLENTSTQKFVNFGSGQAGQHNTASVVSNLVTAINTATINGDLAVSASQKTRAADGFKNAMLVLSGSSSGTAGNLTVTTGSGTDNISTTPLFVTPIKADFTTANIALGFNMQGGTDSTTNSTSFKLKTLADGTIMNNDDTTARTNNVLVSGSKHNIRYEISSVNNSR